VRVTTALAEASGKSRETAVTFTVDPTGGVGGAVYRPLELIVPNVALPPDTPFTDQSTFEVVVPVTVEVNAFVFAVPDVIVKVVGETVTVGAAMIVTTDVADTFGSSNETALTLTAAGEGIFEGA
jgi:hypothetical protein